MGTHDLERGRYADKMRTLGTPLMVTPEEFRAAARLLEKARGYGMSDRMIGAQVGVPDSVPSKVRRGIIETMHRDTYGKLMKLRPERPASRVTPGRGKVGGGAYTDPTGTQRRVQALRADGFPGRVVGDLLGVSYEAVSQLVRHSRPKVLKSTSQDVADVYAGLEGKHPGDFGVLDYAAGKCRTYAARAGYAPRSCWDPDTIDDPGAFPDWTGRCGTPFGRLIHQREGIPVCGRCEEARQPLVFSGARMRAARMRAGLTQRTLERLVGVNQGHVHHWESGRYGPSKERLYRVLLHLDISFEDIYELEDGNGR